MPFLTLLVSLAFGADVNQSDFEILDDSGDWSFIVGHVDCRIAFTKMKKRVGTTEGEPNIMLCSRSNQTASCVHVDKKGKQYYSEIYQLVFETGTEVGWNSEHARLRIDLGGGAATYAGFQMPAPDTLAAKVCSGHYITRFEFEALKQAKSEKPSKKRSR